MTRRSPAPFGPLAGALPLDGEGDGLAQEGGGTALAELALPGSPAGEPVKIDVEPLAFEVDTSPRSRYWMGTFPTCPIQNVTVGGQSFPRYSGTPVFGANGKPDRPPVAGTIGELTEAQLEHVKAAVARRVVRRASGEKGHASIYLRDVAGFAARAGDEPLASHVYLVKLSGAGTTVAGELPPAMDGSAPPSIAPPAAGA